MAWVQVFPTGPTLISQSVQQFQDNWLFLQTNINTDHFFNTGAPNEGHHRFVQMLNGGGDAALAAGMSGVVYTKNNGAGNAQPWYRSANIISQVPIYLPTTYAFVAGANAIDLTVVNGGGQLPAFTGALITITQVGGGGNFTSAIVNYALGGTPTVIPIGHTGVFSNITATGANTLSFTSTGVAGNASINYLMMQSL